MELLGERIKRLRKERKMTLADVAGERLTKGMLSLIENGKAQPSMESLQHIASQLNVDIAELVQNENAVNFAELLVQVQDYTNEMTDIFEKEQLEARYTKVIEMIEPYVDEVLSKGQTYEEVRLYEIYLMMFYYLDRTYDKDKFYQLAKLYEGAKAYRKILNPFTILAMITFNEKNYEKALEHLYEGEPYLNKYRHHIDSLEKLDFYYNLTVLNAAVNNEEKTEFYMNEALTLSNKYRVYYRLNDFYRFAFFTHMQKQEFEKCRYYLKKAEAFSVIMENPIEDIMIFIIKLQACNLIDKNYSKTIEQTFNFSDIDHEIVKQSSVFLNIEYGYAYYQLQRYEKVIEVLQDIYIPFYNNHPIDLASIYRGYALRALALDALGKHEEAKRDILYATDGVKNFHDTIFKQFILDAEKKILHKTSYY